MFDFRIDKVEIHVHADGLASQQFASLHSQGNCIMATQAELATQLSDLAAQTDKAKAEVIQKIADLEAAIANAGSTTPEVDTALAALKAAVQGIDDVVPD